MEISGSHSAIAYARASASFAPGLEADPRSGSKVAAVADAQGARPAEQDAQKATLEKQQQQQERQQQQEIRDLVRRDREVRQHEQAHAAAGGVHAGTPQYELTKGSNGVSYATGGHVKIDVSDVPGDAQATLEKMQTVQRAALAPAQPSAQDRAVAAEAVAKATEARAELRNEKAEAARSAVEAREEQAADPTANSAQANAQISTYQAAESAGNGDRTAGTTLSAYA